MIETRRIRPGEASGPGLAGHASVGAASASPRSRSTLVGDPSTEELTAWRLFLRSHAIVLRRLETDLMHEHQLPLASYDVLVQLVEAPEHRLRMTELADAVLLSRSGLTRLVDRLEREGLVERQACVEDARGLFAVLTDSGLNRLRQASPTHLRGIQDYAVGRLSHDELHEFVRLLAVFTEAEGSGSPPGTQSAGAQPAGTKPAGTKPAGTKPAGTQPAGPPDAGHGTGAVVDLTATSRPAG
jgi:DNA-binding MarR family transcriptional regulator